jgi:hypothetical protein
MVCTRKRLPTVPLNSFAVVESVELVCYDLIATTPTKNYVSLRLAACGIPRPNKIFAGTAKEDILSSIEDEFVAVKSQFVVARAAIKYVVLGASEHTIVTAGAVELILAVGNHAPASIEYLIVANATTEDEVLAGTTIENIASTLAEQLIRAVGAYEHITTIGSELDCGKRNPATHNQRHTHHHQENEDSSHQLLLSFSFPYGLWRSEARLLCMCPLLQTPRSMPHNEPWRISTEAYSPKCVELEFSEVRMQDSA